MSTHLQSLIIGVVGTTLIWAGFEFLGAWGWGAVGLVISFLAFQIADDYDTVRNSNLEVIQAISKIERHLEIDLTQDI